MNGRGAILQDSSLDRLSEAFHREKNIPGLRCSLADYNRGESADASDVEELLHHVSVAICFGVRKIINAEQF